MNPDEARQTWALEREIVLSRVLAAPRDLVFKVWTDPQHLARWFGPGGWATETLEIDVRPNGRWRFVYVSPEGRRYDNRIVFLRFEPPNLIEFDHGSDRDEDPSRFRVTVTFDEQSDGATVVTLRQLHPTREQRDAGVGFGAVAIGYTTLDSLAAYLDAMRAPA